MELICPVDGCSDTVRGASGLEILEGAGEHLEEKHGGLEGGVRLVDIYEGTREV